MIPGYWKAHAAYNHLCRIQLQRRVPGVGDIIRDYQRLTDSTGTKYPTLLAAVKLIQKRKPRLLLEAGTGTSTLVLAETLRQLQLNDSTYQPRLISMESIEKWYNMAVDLFPDSYKTIAEIRFGPREKFEYAMFRGYAHSNVPAGDFDFVFLDGPSYQDEFGSSCCMDAVKIRQHSNVPVVFGVVDTRVSSVYALQQIFGKRTCRYYHLFRSSSFALPKRATAPTLSSGNFSTSVPRLT